MVSENKKVSEINTERVVESENTTFGQNMSKKGNKDSLSVNSEIEDSVVFRHDVSRNYNNNNNLHLVTSRLLAICSSSRLFDITRRGMSINTKFTGALREALVFILERKYFTETMLIIETNLKQRTINRWLNRWLKFGFLERHTTPYYRIADLSHPFWIYYLKGLPKPNDTISIRLTQQQRKCSLTIWLKMKPAEKIFTWINNSYSYLNSKPPDKQRELLFDRMEKYRIRDDQIFAWLKEGYFMDFKMFRSELFHYVIKHYDTVVTLRCKKCEWQTLGRSKRQKICPKCGCKAIIVKEDFEE